MKKQYSLKNRDLEGQYEEFKQYFCRIVHDIKAPIASLQGLVSTTKNHIVDENIKNIFTEIENQFFALNEEVTSSLKNGIAFSKRIDLEPVSFNTVIREILHKINLPAGVTIYPSVYQSSAFKTNKHLVNSIIQNLIYNSIKYARESKDKDLNIFIIVVEEEQKIRLRIEDDGIGLSETVINKLLIDREPSNNNLMMIDKGLGLFIVKKCVERLKGHMTINSQLGTQFNIELPKL